MSTTQTRPTTFDVISGSPGSTKHQRLGTVKLTAEKTFTRTYETAAWFQDIIVPEGAEAELWTNGYWVFATFDGVKGRSNFTSLYGGVPIGKGKVDENMGEPDKYGVQFYVYEVAKAIMAGTFLNGADVRLDDEVAIVHTHFDHGEHGGVKYHAKFAVAKTEEA